MECVNCGKIGHSFRDCTEPVYSFGVIPVKFVEGQPQFLLIRRRDSLSYVEFLRGKYKLDKNAYIQLLINNMTGEERGRLLTNTFDVLWNMLWNGQNTRQYRNEYDFAKRTFDTLKNTGDIYGKLLNRYVEEATMHWSEPEWGFPKGRRIIRENDKICALREFTEETGLRGTDIHLIEDEPPYIEEYLGTNNVRYRQCYFLGCCSSELSVALQSDNRVMRREVGGIGWFSYSEALSKIRSTNAEKRIVLETLYTNITTTTLKERLLGSLEWSHVRS
jgi:8-oxo-dGTP pyrophosphatase MutT (NUDIX family)